MRDVDPLVYDPFTLNASGTVSILNREQSTVVELCGFALSVEMGIGAKYDVCRA